MKLHLGCGPIKLKGFVNIDISDHHKPDVCMDYLKLGDTYSESSIECIYTCHSIEHLEYPAGVVKFFETAFKALRSGGILRVVVPDLKAVARKYVNGEDLKDIYNFNAYAYKECPAERFTFFARGWEHTVLFDKQLLSMLMADAGFTNITECVFNQSTTPSLRGHDRFSTESIVMECSKP